MSSPTILTEARQRARALDQDDPLAFTRSEFNIPTKAQIASTRLPDSATTVDAGSGDAATADDKCVYLCGNSLGLQPKRTQTRINQYLSTWATQGVQGHFKPLEDSPLPTWLDADERAAQMIAPIVGASEAEVAVMQTLTANLHLLMSAFYRPDINGRHKIILESKAFPSDHLKPNSATTPLPATSMITLTSPSSPRDNILTTAEILSFLSLHGPTTALLLLPGIQYYTGQLLDIPTITSAAHSHGIFVIWDLAHAVGNVPLHLQKWGVDAAAWCSYKYLNSGPGGIGGMFVHERHSSVTKLITEERPEEGYTNRLAGWWGNEKRTRFGMENRFHPVKGAAGFQDCVNFVQAFGEALEVARRERDA
ncbi:Kynureninase (L-kynurenine hydrolase) [Collariella sp. IMI 366227]|nr:Kynureninase (L-kynurenine hydrolase) [Collariella sp. IMI 366227]